MMICPYCDNELIWEDSFGRFAGFGDGKVLGNIYRCPLGAEESEECESSTHYVAGSFYQYTEGSQELHNGYPC